MYKVNIEDYKGYHQERKAKAWNNLIDIVNNSNYKLLDNFENYKNNSIKLKFQCDKNHVFYTTLGNFKNNSRRCPICSGRKSLHKDGFLGEIKDICRDIDYTLISTEYKNSKSKLNFKCSENHIFQMTTSNFKFGQRCPYCAGFKSTHINGFLGEIQDICKKINYTLISKKYKGVFFKLIFKCNKDHKFEMSADKFKQGKRCPYCSKNKSYHINGFLGDINDICKKINYILISKKYKGCESKLKFKCNKGHKFEMTPSSFKKGYRCSYCSKHKSEQKTREIFKELFKMQFDTNRPEWLKHKKYPLELDGYNEELKLAFEYQGEQHYEYVKYFHKNGRTLQKQQQRDQFKRDKCKEKEITLIQVPYWIDLDFLEDFITEQLIKEKRIDLILWIKKQKLSS